MMKTMPRAQMRAMRFLLERLLTTITRWEDQHADPEDYRMRALSGGLHQASQSLRELIEGRFNPLRGAVERLERDDSLLGAQYTQELLRDVSIPLQPGPRHI